MMYDVAVIIVNYNSSQYTLDCVESVVNLTAESLSYHIVVVDNASKPEEVELLQKLENRSGISIIYSDINLGFGGANMIASQQLQAKYLFFLNNDCLLLNDCIDLLKNFCDANPQTGMCGPQMYSGSGQKILSFNYTPTPALKFLGPSFLRLFYPDRYPNRRREYQSPVKVDLVPGSGLFINSTAFHQIGGFDPNLFFYCEEEDLAERLKTHAWHVYFVPEAHYIHFGGGSSSTNLIMLKEYYISLMYFFRKHYSPIAYAFLKVLFAFKVFKKSLKDRRHLPLILFILKGAPQKYSLRFHQ